MAQPTEIRKLAGGAGIKLTWDDGKVNQIPARLLRLSCHCASCRHELTGEIILNEASIPADITILKAEIIGQYALGFQFSDGHSTGIYTFEQLHKL